MYLTFLIPSTLILLLNNKSSFIDDLMEVQTNSWTVSLVLSVEDTSVTWINHHNNTFFRLLYNFHHALDPDIINVLLHYCCYFHHSIKVILSKDDVVYSIFLTDSGDRYERFDDDSLSNLMIDCLSESYLLSNQHLWSFVI